MISEPRNRGFGNRDTLFQQSGPQLLERDAWLLADPSLDLFLMPLQGVRLMPSELVGLNIAGGTQTPAKSCHRAEAHLVVFGGLLNRAPARKGLNDGFPQLL